MSHIPTFSALVRRSVGAWRVAIESHRRDAHAGQLDKGCAACLELERKRAAAEVEAQPIPHEAISEALGRLGLQKRSLDTMPSGQRWRVLNMARAIAQLDGQTGGQK